MALTCDDNRLTTPDDAWPLLTLALSLAFSHIGSGHRPEVTRGLKLVTERAARRIQSRALSGHLYCRRHEDLSGADEPSQLGGADHEGAVVGVVFQVEGGGQRPS